MSFRFYSFVFSRYRNLKDSYNPMDTGSAATRAACKHETGCFNYACLRFTTAGMTNLCGPPYMSCLHNYIRKKQIIK